MAFDQDNHWAYYHRCVFHNHWPSCLSTYCVHNEEDDRGWYEPGRGRAEDD